MRSNCLVDSDDAMDETCVTWYIKKKVIGLTILRNTAYHFPILGL